MSNTIRSFGTKKDIPVQEIAEFIEKSIEGDNGLLIIGTNHVDNRHENSPDAQILTIKVNPDVVAGAIVNQALNASDVENMLALCDELQRIGEFAGRMINKELQRRQRSN